VRRQTLIFLWLGLAIGAGATAGIFLLVDSGDEDVAEAVDRPASRGKVTSPAKTIQVSDKSKLPALTRSQRRSEVAPEHLPLTPIAAAADLVESKDFAATELQDPSDPRGTDEAFGLFKNTLVHKKSAIYIAEPTVASKGDRVFVTWNSGAGFSSDGGETFRYVDPSTAFPRAVGGYCCDQVGYYVPGRDLWVWFIQYWPNKKGRNIVRLAIARGDEGFDQRKFHYYDISTKLFPDLKFGRNSDLDYPNVSATQDHLYLSINAYWRTFHSTVVMRMPLDDLAEKKPFRYDWMYSGFGTAEFAEGATDTMYFAEHLSTSALKVWRWKDEEPGPFDFNVDHSEYSYPQRPIYACPRSGATKGDWCARKTKNGDYTNDDRPTGGWIAGDTIGFAWNSPQDKQRGFPYPYVMAVRIDRNTMTLKDEPFIWSPNRAYEYAAFSPNARGDVAGMVLSGGGDRYQTCSTLINDGQTQGGWDARAVHSSDADSDEDKAGDYLGVTPVASGANSWAGSCMTVNGGSSAENVEIRHFRFGRVKDRGN
jgi:hypothetical protein